MSSRRKHREARTRKLVVWDVARRRAQAVERGLSALTIGQLSAAQAGAFCCTICSYCTRLAAVRPRRYSPSGLQLEHEQHSGNGLRSELDTRSAERTTKPDPDGRLVRRLQPRRTWDLYGFATKVQICTYLRLDHVGKNVHLKDLPNITNGGVVLFDGNEA